MKIIKIYSKKNNNRIQNPKEGKIFKKEISLGGLDNNKFDRNYSYEIDCDWNHLDWKEISIVSSGAITNLEAICE
ncbi:MAG: hypothetical protein SFU98_12575 [Leptospiraceae bacterium]|nr:hypothetical protein [Leptospiraceae bacterium]